MNIKCPFLSKGSISVLANQAEIVVNFCFSNANMHHGQSEKIKKETLSDVMAQMHKLQI